MKRIFVCWLGLALAAPALAQDNPPLLTYTVAAKPAALPVPALKYQLLPEVKDLTAGNALTKYYKSFSPEWWGTIQRHDSKWHEDADKALEAPLDKMPPEYAFVQTWKMLQEVDRGARMDHCDWELVSRLKEDGFGTLIPDAQSLRMVARFLALRIRYEIAAGEIDKAIDSLQTGFALARHAGEAPSLIHMLIGVAISQIMAKQMDELIQHPKCPNLYWALSRLPRPYFDMRRPLGGELLMSDLVVAELDELRKGPIKSERAQEIMEGFNRRNKKWGFPTLKPAEFAARSQAIYPKAKAALIAKGRAKTEVDAMPMPQVLLLHSMEEFLRLRDDVYKWMLLPITESEANLQKALAAVEEAKKREDFFTELLEGISSANTVRYAAVRADRRFAMLRIVEAIRSYAVQSDGKVPAQLSDMTELPIPLDPMTGKSFEYSVKDGIVSISGPAITGMKANQVMTYRVTIKK